MEFDDLPCQQLNVSSNGFNKRLCIDDKEDNSDLQIVQIKYSFIQSTSCHYSIFSPAKGF